MKIIFKASFTLFFLATPFVFASTLPSLKCVTGGFPTTSFILTAQSENVEVRVINHNGINYAPLYSGLMTINDISYLKRSADFFSKLGDDFTVKFATERCRFEQNKFFTCSQVNAAEFNGVKVDSIYFSTTESVDKIPDFEFNRTNVKISFRKGDEEYKIEMSYYDNSCELDFKKSFVIKK